jgi:hypothetical protein
MHDCCRERIRALEMLVRLPESPKHESNLTYHVQQGCSPACSDPEQKTTSILGSTNCDIVTEAQWNILEYLRSLPIPSKRPAGPLRFEYPGPMPTLQ